MISSMPVQFVQSEEIELWLMYFSALSSIEKKSYGTRAGKIGKNTRQIQMQQSPSWEAKSYSRNSPHFMETKISSPHSDSEDSLNIS